MPDEQDPEVTAIIDKVTETKTGVIDPSTYENMTGDTEDLGAEATPYIQLIQGLSATELKEEFGEGSIVLQPNGVCLAKKGKTFDAVAVYQWLTWQKVRDPNDGGDEFYIVTESYDSNSDTAKRAEDWDNKFGGRTEVYEDDANLSFSFITVIHVALVIGEEYGVVSFKKGGFKDGKRLYKRLKSFRKDGKAQPLFAYKIKFGAEDRPTPNGKSTNGFITASVSDATDQEKDWPVYAKAYLNCTEVHAAAKAAELSDT